jgi:hypothetical protein
MTAALAERLHAEPHLRLRYFCSPYHQDSALYPFIDQLGRAAGFARDDPPAARQTPGFAMAASVLSLAVRLTELHRSWDRTPFGHAHDAAGCI